MTEPRPRFYDELAEWWPLFSPPEHYAEEADDLLRRLPPVNTPGRPTLLELGCGGGSDVVLIHDAIMYATDAASLRAALETAAAHCRAGGTVVVLPDYVRETFTPGTEEGGHDASDGRGLRYLEWCWDPDPNDDTYVVDYAFLLREVSGEVRVVHDRHVEGLFPRARWFEWFEAAGLSAQSDRDQWGSDVFVARRVKADAFR